MIDSYKFGHIVIDGITYKNDVVVFLDHVQSEWWRKEGHKLQIEDILDQLKEAEPEVLVVGTGKFGLMRIGDDLKDYLDETGIRLVVENTDRAVSTYNRVVENGDRVLGAFHLTC